MRKIAWRLEGGRGGRIGEEGEVDRVRTEGGGGGLGHSV